MLWYRWLVSHLSHTALLRLVVPFVKIYFFRLGQVCRTVYEKNNNYLLIYLQSHADRVSTEKKRRKASMVRGDLRRAAEAVRTGQMGVREACRNFKIPPPTFRRRLKNNDFSRKGLGPPSILGSENELKLKNHIQKLEKHGFAPTRDCVRAMAFNLAEQLNIKHTFNREKGLAGYDWLNMFLKRNPDLSVRKAEGVSLARCQGMNKNEVSSYFTLLQNVLEEADIMGKPGHLFNMDET